ncbi:MAG: hypothetical protein H6565_12065 [Lewinellaceae bacterium]|nr:hypothetical protein [Lewinellaceae bacterium]MCB9355206.1 hypothetical protein [Lewinellaceae bacterium]
MKVFALSLITILSSYIATISAQQYCEWDYVTIRNVVIGNNNDFSKKFEEVLQNVIDDKEFSCKFISSKFAGLKYQILNDFNENARKQEFEIEKNLNPELKNFIFLTYSKIDAQTIRVNGYLHNINHTEILEQIDVDTLQFRALSLEEQKEKARRFLRDFKRTHIEGPNYTNENVCKIFISGFEIINNRCITSDLAPEILLKNFIEKKFDHPTVSARVEFANEFRDFENERIQARNKFFDIIVSAKQMNLHCPDLESSKAQYVYEVITPYSNPYINSGLISSEINTIKSLNQKFINIDLKKPPFGYHMKRKSVLVKIKPPNVFLRR